jgi:hypothetical protein
MTSPHYTPGEYVQRAYNRGDASIDLLASATASVRLSSLSSVVGVAPQLNPGMRRFIFADFPGYTANHVVKFRTFGFKRRTTFDRICH